MDKERRRINRRNISYYLPIFDAASKKPIGIMMDISLGGFRIDSRTPIPDGQVNRLRINLTKDIAPKAALVFSGQSKWCRPDTFEPSLYNAGFEVVDMSPADALIYQRIFQNYGLPADSREVNNPDYLWK